MGSDSASIFNHPLLWRGNQVSHHIPTLHTGHACLDRILPGNGWPRGAVTELVHDTTACGELSLLLPALAGLSHEGRRVIMVDPPWIPYPSSLAERGLALEKLLLIRTRNKKESLWACEQVVRGMPGGAMLAWPDEISFSELRRLQMAAKNSHQSVFLFRHKAAKNVPSPAELRLQLEAFDGDLKVSVLKCRGQRSSLGTRIHRSQLFQTPATILPASNDHDKTCSPRMRPRVSGKPAQTAETQGRY